MLNHSQFNLDRAHPGRWTITFSNPPINIFVPTTIVELRALMADLEADPAVKVVVFESANPDFFIAHLDVAKAAERPEALGQTVLTKIKEQIRDEVRGGRMRAIRADQFLVNLLSLCIFPFAAQPMLAALLGLDGERFSRFIHDRKRELPEFFMKALQP